MPQIASKAMMTALLVAAAGCAHERQTIEIQASDEPATLEQAEQRLQNRGPWTEFPELSLAQHPAEKYLAGFAIVLDPGHGGHADQEGYKRGPTGVREAEINWRIACLLRDMLQTAGAQVVLTRDGDKAVSLEDRAKIANTLPRDRDGVIGADLLLSIHHNLSPNADTNWSSVWFHDDPNNSEVGIDVGRYIAHRVGEALRTQVAKTSPLMSDRQMYAGGFGILRYSEVPACLAELSFYSNPQEEQRLRDAMYNLRCAHAIYVALCEYAYGGRPSQELPTVSQEAEASRLTVSTVLSDGMPEGWWGGDRTRILRDSIAVTLNDVDVPIEFDPASRSLEFEVDPESLSGEQNVVKIRHCNFFKHANWPQRFEMAKDDSGDWKLSPLPAKRISGDVPAGGS